MLSIPQTTLTPSRPTAGPWPCPCPWAQSVLGIGAFAREHGADIACVDERGMQDWLDSPKGARLAGVLICFGGEHHRLLGRLRTLGH